MSDTVFTWIPQVAEFVGPAARSPLGFAALSIGTVAILGLIIKPFGDAYKVLFLIILGLAVVFLAIGIWLEGVNQPLRTAAEGSSDNIAIGAGREIDNRLTQIDNLLQEAYRLRAKDRLMEARADLDQAKRLLPDTGDRLREGQIASAFGQIERIGGNLVLARKYFEESLSVLPETARTERAGARLQLGITLRQQDHRSAARGEIETALRDFRALLDRNGEGLAAIELAELYILESNYEQALALLNESATAMNTAGNTIGLANVDGARGKIERMRDRPQLAIPYLHI